MKEKILTIYKLNKFAQDPKKINRNTFEFYADKDHEIINKKNNTIHSGFYIQDADHIVVPSNIYIRYNLIPYSYQAKESELAINAYCHTENVSDKHFATRYKIIHKSSCIFYVTIVESEYEENYNLNIINR
jgi:hypothetical protein